MTNPLPKTDASSSAPPAGSNWSAWLTRVGPGFVYISTVIGAGDLVSNATAGASYGYHLIWALGMTLIFRFVWVNTSAKYVLVTGESLFTGYARVGRWIPGLFLVFILLARFLYMSYSILLMGDTANLLLPLLTRWSTQVWASLFTVIGFVITFWGGYRLVETFCKFLVGLMGGSLMIAAVLSRPDPVQVLSGTFIPSLPQAEGLYSAILIILALIGTEVGATANLNYAYYIYEKGWRDPSYLKLQRFDLLLGIAAMFLIGALLQIAAAGTIHSIGIEPEDATDLARIFSETMGTLGMVVFALGLWGASFSTFVGGNTGGALIIRDICRRFVPGLKRSIQDQPATEDAIYRWIIVFWSFAPLGIAFSGVRPVWFVLVVSALLVLVVPLMVLSLLKITNDPGLMGEYRNGWLTNLIMLVLVLVVIYLTYVHFLDFWEKLDG